MPKFFDWLKKSHTNSTVPSTSRINNVAPISRESFVDFVLAQGNRRLAYSLINHYYSTCAPLATAVDLINENLASIPPHVFDTSTRAFENKKQAAKDILKLLKNPNGYQIYVQFIERLAGFFQLYGEGFVEATGRRDNAPLELWVVSPASVSVTEGSDGLVSEITVNTVGGSERFFPEIRSAGRIRYFNRRSDDDGKFDVKDKEIYHIKNFSPKGTTISRQGVSPLQSISFEIEQWLGAGTHNLSLLLRSARPSGIFETDQDLLGLSVDQREELNEVIRGFFDGPSNAGRTALASNGMKWTPIGMTNQDLDFIKTKEQIQKDIYNRLRIPLPLVTEKTMTMANMDASAILLYDNAVKPLLSRLLQELSTLLFYRYEDSENLVLKIDEGTVSVLETRRNENAIRLKESGATTINDRRSVLNYESLAHGGGDVYGDSNQIPLASDDKQATDFVGSSQSASNAPIAPQAEEKNSQISLGFTAKGPDGSTKNYTYPIDIGQRETS